MDLKPCPFCGGVSTILITEGDIGWSIGCWNVDCDIQPTASGYPNKKHCISVWNTRKGDTDENEIQD